MKNPDTPHATLSNLLASNRSGVVALCGNPDLENGLDYMLYFKSLGILTIVYGEWGCRYFDIDAKGLRTQVLDEFAERQDIHTLAELGIDENEFVRTELNNQLWRMAHDYADAPEGFDWNRLAFRDERFTLFGGDDLETDIEQFHTIIPATYCDWRNIYARTRFSMDRDA